MDEMRPARSCSGCVCDDVHNFDAAPNVIPPLEIVCVSVTASANLFACLPALRPVQGERRDDDGQVIWPTGASHHWGLNTVRNSGHREAGRQAGRPAGRQAGRERQAGRPGQQEQQMEMPSRMTKLVARLCAQPRPAHDSQGCGHTLP